MDEPKHIANPSPAIRKFLEPLASQIADDTKTDPRHPLQHPECPKVAGTLNCLEAGGEMCEECQWWASINPDPEED